MYIYICVYLSIYIYECTCRGGWACAARSAPRLVMELTLMLRTLPAEADWTYDQN